MHTYAGNIHTLIYIHIHIQADCHSGGSTSGQQWALPPPPPQFNGLPPSLQLYCPNFFAQTLLPMYNVANGVDGWKRLEITIEIMN